MAWKGAVVRKTSDQTSANYSALTAVAFDNEVIDTDAWHDNSTNNTRLTVPAGVTHVRIFGQIYPYTVSATVPTVLEIHKNGAALSPQVISYETTLAGFSPTQIVSGILAVTAGDYFELMHQTPADTSNTIIAAYVWVSIEAVEFPLPTFAGAIVKKAADQTAANYTTATAIAFDSEIADTNSFHDNVTNNRRLTVPAGVSKVRLSGQVGISAITSGQWRFLILQKDGAVANPATQTSHATEGTSVISSFVSPVYSVSATNYFEIQLYVQSDTSITIVADQTWFSIEVVE